MWGSDYEGAPTNKFGGGSIRKKLKTIWARVGPSLQNWFSFCLAFLGAGQAIVHVPYFHHPLEHLFGSCF